MKRSLVSITIIYTLLMGSFFAMFVFEPEPVAASKTLYVGGTGQGNYSSISSAINAATYGDTIFVFAGTYYENVFMKSNINLVGEDANRTIIDAKRGKRSILCASNNNINGFTLRNFSVAGITAEKINNVIMRNLIVIVDCPVVSNTDGITVLASKVDIINTVVIAPRRARNAIITDAGANDIKVKNTIVYGNFETGYDVQGGVARSSYNNIYLTKYTDKKWYDKVQKGTGDISKDPKFVNSSINYLNVHLTQSSPCIDTGDPLDPVPPNGGNRIDMGALEFDSVQLTKPGSPRNLVAKVEKNKINLDWLAPLSDGNSPIIKYNIYRGLSTNDLSIYSTIGNDYYYYDTDVSANVTYYYKVSAENKNGEGPFSNIANALIEEIIEIPPEFAEIVSPPEVYRTESLPFSIYIIDDGPLSQINLTVEYKSPKDTTWKNEFLSTPEFVNGRWDFDFTPPKNAKTGKFSFRFSARDSHQFETVYNRTYHVMVLNNKPLPPEITISPLHPKTVDDLVVETLKEPSDVETEPFELELKYRWFNNNISVPEFNNYLELPSTATKKNENWRCEVTTFDGENQSIPAFAEVLIGNSAPYVKNQLDSFEFLEDRETDLNKDLYQVFKDDDYDILYFRTEGQNNIKITIDNTTGMVSLAAPENWFGTELVTFYANDSISEAKTIVELTVVPVNDLPVITKIGSMDVKEIEEDLSFIVNERQWLNLSITVEDNDGDVGKGKIKYKMNITKRNNLYIDNSTGTLKFNPAPSDIGWHHLKISVTDGYNSPNIFVSKNIKIYVVNINDPPYVKIQKPYSFQKFNEPDVIVFSCIGFDDDLNTPDSVENLNYEWFISSPFEEKLGEGDTIEVLTLQQGSYTVTVIVTDNAGMKGTDSVRIHVKAVEDTNERFSEKTESINPLAVFLLVIIILAVVGFFLFVVKRLKKDREKPEQSGEKPIISASGRKLKKIRKTHVEPLQEVSSRQTFKQIQSKPTVQKITPLEKLELLEVRFLKGDIPLDEYKGMKTKYQKEASRYGIHPEALAAMPVESPVKKNTEPSTDIEHSG